MATTEIYITGMGIVSALGIGVETTLEAVRNERTGIAPVRFLQTKHTELPVGEVKYSNDEMREMLRIPTGLPTVRSSLLGMLAVDEAMAQAHIADDNRLQKAFVSGITVGGMDMVENMYIKMLETDCCNQYIDLNDCGACTEQIADHFGGFDFVATIVTACSSSANTLMTAADLIRTGRADVAVAGGCECLSRYHVNGFNTLMILDRQICRPFDRDRAGINLGEGAGYLVLESAESVRRRGVQPLARLSGYFNACDAYHPTASSPDGHGAFLAMQGAIADARLTPADIDYINAHGTGTPNNDLTEGLAVMRLFADRIPPLSSLKSLTGHTTSAAGSIEAVVSILAMQHQFLPVNSNFRNRIPELSFDPVTNATPHRPIRHVLSNAFGFGGNNSAIVLSSI